MGDVEIVGGSAGLPAEEIRQRIREYLASREVVRAILFGSCARGEADSFSDVDLVLIESTPRPFTERGLAHLPLLHIGAGVGADLLIYTPEEFEALARDGNPLIERVEREGVVVYERPAS
jgi:predicted nucleotidyltransferase